MINSDSISAPLKPFETIGLCFSGGGYRASAFSLGVLDYLQRVSFDERPLLDKVIALSSVSGGTITAATYAASQAKGDSFATFYRKLYTFLKEDKLVDEAVSKFMDEEVWRNTTRSRSIINGFALTYFERLVEESFRELDPDSMQGHLKYVAFNATEFSFGLAFRFQNANMFGNYPLNCQELEAVAPSIRIADAIASSSCFPGGFDPMIFPNDYFEDHQSETYLKLVKVDNFKNGIGIMDGGIVDNQGIGSMVNFDKSSKNGFPLDLLIINDVDGYKMKPWEKFTPSNSTGEAEPLDSLVNRYLAYLQLKPLYWVGLSLSGLSLWYFFGLDWAMLTSMLSGLVGVFSVLTVLGLVGNVLVGKIKRKIKEEFVSNIPTPLQDDVEKFTQLQVSQVREMIQNRFTSAMKMINSVFLRQIRRINFDYFYTSPRFKNRRITSMVYQLNGLQNNVSNENQKKKANQVTVSDSIKAVALSASEMPTTLWWRENDIQENRQDKLIACGQFTTCYNLIKYIQDLPSEYNSLEVKNLEKLLLEDWSKFETNPLVFVGKE
ncbi:patatin-like phospholipase family protein [Algoriphagus sp.]|uniref:patatin-like phospholipase family protein n=1 Tax=Algoriphagus sp. TaxID=1872435 RepID=UPI0032711761